MLAGFAWPCPDCRYRIASYMPVSIVTEMPSLLLKLRAEKPEKRAESPLAFLTARWIQSLAVCRGTRAVRCHRDASLRTSREWKQRGKDFAARCRPGPLGAGAVHLQARSLHPRPRVMRSSTSAPGGVGLARWPDRTPRALERIRSAGKRDETLRYLFGVPGLGAGARAELGVQQRAEAEREAEQQPLDGVVALISRSDAQWGDGVPGRARGALDEGDGERGGNREVQATEALVARQESGGAVAEGAERAVVG